jgi:hypothetical protein
MQPTLATCHQDARAQPRGGFLFLDNIPQNGKPIQLSGNISITYKILKIIAVYTVQTEHSALLVNTKQARVMRFFLTELDHPQPSTPINS